MYLEMSYLIKCVRAFVKNMLQSYLLINNKKTCKNTKTTYTPTPKNLLTYPHQNQRQKTHINSYTHQPHNQTSLQYNTTPFYNTQRHPL